jgi:hypothetical protein
LKLLNSNFVNQFAKIDAFDKSNYNQMNSLSFLTSYLFEFNQKLYNEYLVRSKFGFDFNKERVNYLKKNKIIV